MNNTTTTKLEELALLLTATGELNMAVPDVLWMVNELIGIEATERLAGRARDCSGEYPLLAFSALVKTHLEATGRIRLVPEGS